MKRFLNGKYGETVILSAAYLLNLLFTVICFSIPLLEVNFDNNGVATPTLWNATEIYTENYVVRNVNVFLIIALLVGIALFIAAALLCLFARKKVMFYVSIGYNLALSVILLFLHLVLGFLQSGAVACAVISVVISVAMLIFLLLRRRSAADSEDGGESEDAAVLPVNVKAAKITLIVCEGLSAVFMALTLFVPLYSQIAYGSVTQFILINSLTDTSYPLYVGIMFMLMFVFCFVGLIYFITTLSYLKNVNMFAKKARDFTLGISIFTFAFFFVGYALTFYNNMANKGAEPGLYSATTVSYVPFIFAIASFCVASVAQGRIGFAYLPKEKAQKVAGLKIEPIIYVALLTISTFATLIVDVIRINCNYSGISLQDVRLSGLQLLTDSATLESGFQIMSFILLAILIASGLMLLICVISFFAKNKDYYKVIKTAAISNVVFTALMGLFGLYFKIAQKVNYENIASLLEHYGVAIPEGFEYTASSQTIYLLIVSVVILIIMLVRKQFNLAVEQSEMDVTLSNPDDIAATNGALVAATENANGEDYSFDGQNVSEDFDACPAFTEIDGKVGEFERELWTKRQRLFENLTLPNLVRFVVDYARESRLHLSYSLESIATFVAGLGASRLTILQGMSGTGKTSLPKIFTEAIMGTCEIVEVESSWRDKNELLGYYNEFSKCYTPKKFTQCLYKAKLNPDVFTLIVLDEMNLSRIEYYFSDFLSLMEHEEDKREIKLLNVKLFRTEGGEKFTYFGLTDGHTIKIPSNVWFVGTANRDESTFAISDKVYDRAQTMNFNKRAPKIYSFSEPLAQRYVSQQMLSRLFDDAKNSGDFDAENDATVKSVEKLLAPYNISFGNRILRQMEDFVKIYCACFGDRDAVLKEAVEKILFSKVVSKLENKVVENKESLAKEFDKLGLALCSEFVRKLNED